MGLWHLFSILVVGIPTLWHCMFRQKRKKLERVIKSQVVQLKAKDSELQEKDYAFKNEIEQLKKEKDTLEAKYLYLAIVNFEF